MCTDKYNANNNHCNPEYWSEIKKQKAAHKGAVIDITLKVIKTIKNAVKMLKNFELLTFFKGAFPFIFYRLLIVEVIIAYSIFSDVIKPFVTLFDFL